MAVTYDSTKKKPQDPWSYDVYGATRPTAGAASSPAVATARPTPNIGTGPAGGVGGEGGGIGAPPSGGFARGAFDAIATAADASQMPVRGGLNLANRAAVGVRNFVREGLGKDPVEAAQLGYSPMRDALADLRASNARPQPQTPALAGGGGGPSGAPRPVTFFTGDDTSNYGTPPSNRGLPVPSAGAARAPGGATPAGGGTLAGAAPAAANDGDRVVGTYNGRQITQSEADALAAKLPTASGPVAFGPNGSYVAATGSAAPTPTASPAPDAPPAYGFSAPRPDTTRIRVADEARAKQISALQDQLRNIGPLNMRSKRDLAATLQAQISQLTGGQGELAQSGANNELDAATRLQQQGMSDAANAAVAQAAQQGEDRRALLAQQGETGRTAYREFGDTYRNERNVQATLATRPVPSTTADNKLQSDLAASAQKFLEGVTPAGKDGTYSDEQIAAAQASAQQLYGVQEAPPVEGAQRAPDGNWYVKNDDGSYSRVKL